MKTLPNLKSTAASLILTVLVAVTSSLTVMAEEDIFGYITSAETVSKGEWEGSQWITGRFGKQTGSYAAADLNTEIEYGITDKLQTGFYFNNEFHRARNANTGAGSYPAIDDRNSFDFSGVTLELKYQVLSPYSHPVGLTLYFEPGWSRRDKVEGDHNTELEVEFKIILQKHFRNDSVVTTVNFALEPEWERGAGDSSYGGELKFEGGFGAAYRFAPGWYAGVETIVRATADNMDINDFENVTLFAGPTLHYSTRSWWATLTVLPQVAGWPSDKGTGGLELEDHERLEVRLKTGVDF